MTDLDIVIERIHALTLQDDYDDPVPTSALITRAVGLCQSTALLMARPFPRAAASHGERGSISLYWMKPGRCAVTVDLHESDTAQDYLYHRETATKQSAIEYSLTPELLAQWLDWYSEQLETPA